jgi:peptidoglycan lytic transglycosylase
LDIVPRKALAMMLVLGAAAAGAPGGTAAAARGRRAAPAKPPRPPRAAASDAAAVQQLRRALHAYREGDYPAALTGAAAIAGPRTALRNRDYALYVAAQSALLTHSPARALGWLRELATLKDSRFRDAAAWRAADALWDLGKIDEARKAYLKLVPPPAPAREQTGDLTDGNFAGGDAAVALDRLAQADEAAGEHGKALAAWRRLTVEHPAHPLAAAAEKQIVTAGAPVTARERVERAERLTADRAWERALEELALVPDAEAQDVRDLRDYWIGTTLYKMRRRYDRAAKLLLSVADRMGERAVEALFHGARAASRADDDDGAIRGYRQVVARYPRSEYAAEAQFLSGWLEFNRGRYRQALPGLEGALKKYPRSRWADDAAWYLAFSHYLLGDCDQALKYLEPLTARGGSLEGGKARYWRARCFLALGRKDAAVASFADVVMNWPFSWYAQLARARLGAAGIEIGPFGERGAGDASSDGPDRRERGDRLAGVMALDAADPALGGEPAVARADELIAAGQGVEAGFELRRGEAALLKRYGPARALPVLIDRYRRAGNYNRPWELADAYGGTALRVPPVGPARVWWEIAFPRAYQDFIEKYQGLGENPPYYLYSIMRKESGYDPHVVSYADAIGLLQMIPATTRRVAHELGIPYTDDLLYDPELNIEVGAWYIGRLALKFKQQIPVSAGSFNCGPRPVMRWLEQNGKRPLDEWVELVAYTQTREYMKKVTGYYARYLWLYEGRDYQQPLTLDPDYIKNDLDY